ncbi:MAG: PIN domain-containing protein [Candidatus Diapherotrites archaeon]
MKQRFYVDSCIWRDFFEERKDCFRPLGEFAFLFLKYCKKNNCVIIYSEMILKELAVFYGMKKTLYLLETAKEWCQLIKAEISEDQVAEAEKIKQKFEVPFGDALHAVIARDRKAVFVSRDLHFERLKEFVECLKPEEII